MPKIAEFAIATTRIIDADGKAIEPLPPFARDPAELIGLYRAMVLTRTFDAKAIALQRTGRLGTYASSLGQEAVSVGVAAAMQPTDVLLPSFREHGAQIWRGVTLKELLLYWGGDERGNDFAGPREDFPNCVPVGSHAPHAVGVALAFKLRDERRAAVCIFGDGATSKGDVAEALNMAGVWKVPAVFVVVQQRLGDLGSGGEADRSRRARPEGHRRRHPWRAGGRQRRDCRPSVVEQALARARDGRRADAGRGGHLSAVRPHHRRRCQPLSRRCRGEPALAVRSRSRGCAISCCAASSGTSTRKRSCCTSATAPSNRPPRSIWRRLHCPPSAAFDHVYANIPAELAEQRALAASRLREAA